MGKKIVGSKPLNAAVIMTVCRATNSIYLLEHYVLTTGLSVGMIYH